MFDLPRKDEFTQGTVFTCATAENYPVHSVNGLVITARCDAAQDKTPIYNYVPVIKLEDWMVADGGQIALERAISDCENNIKNIIIQAELSDTLIKSKTYLEIYNAHLLDKSAVDKGWGKRCNSFLELTQSHTEIKKAIDSDDRDEKKRLIQKYNKNVDTVIKELAGNRLVGFYLLRDLPNIHDESVGNYVALLREIRHISKPIAKKIAKGLSKEDASNIKGIFCPRFVGDDDFSLPIARLKSPWVEHLMQNLTMVFARVGVDDVDFKSVKKSLASLGLET